VFRCWHCGASQAATNYCVQCGMPSTPPPGTPDPMGDQQTQGPPLPSDESPRVSSGRSSILAIGILVVAVIGAIVFVASRADPGPGDQSSAGGRSSLVDRYPAGVRSNFLHACNSNGGTFASCSCMLNELERDYTLDEYAVMEQRTLDGDFPDEFMAVVEACVS
jgi:hypothetical protein